MYHRVSTLARVLFVLAALLVALAGTSGGAKAASVSSAAHGGGSAAPLYIQCSSTFWALIDTHTGTPATNDTITAHLYALEDSVNHAYCGNLKSDTTYSVTGACHTIGAIVVNANTGTTLKQVWTGCTTGSSDIATTYSPGSSGCYAAIAGFDGIGQYATVGYCI